MIADSDYACIHCTISTPYVKSFSCHPSRTLKYLSLTLENHLCPCILHILHATPECCRVTHYDTYQKTIVKNNGLNIDESSNTTVRTIESIGLYLISP